MVNEGKVVGHNGSFFSKMKDYYFDYSLKPFYYNISGINFNLDDIKQGMLRGNQRKPGSFFRTINVNDPKTQILSNVSIC